jgi:hypothetical protein
MSRFFAAEYLSDWSHSRQKRPSSNPFDFEPGAPGLDFETWDVTAFNQ